jgi:hypothetical protein
VEGEALPDQTLINEIEANGKVAVNDFGLVAFQGKVEIEDGPFDETLRAVFTSQELLAREGTTLSDDNTIEEIEEVGGVAINDFGDVAFHGFVVIPSEGRDSFKAVFTQERMLVREGSELSDGNLLYDINEYGGVAFSNAKTVAFHGDALAPGSGVDSVEAIFTQDKVLVREGDTLLDGAVVGEIDVDGGIAINWFGQVAFHGRTGDRTEAVFTQDGLVAKIGDNLTDGTTLTDISPTAGVSINFYGEVAFHGRSGTTDKVLVGQAQDPEAALDDFPPE